MNGSATMHEGGCRCGAVRYRMKGEPIFVNCCHCRDCQTLTGSAFAINAMIEAERVTLLAGAPAKTAEGAMRCPDCGVLLWASHPMFGEGLHFLRAGTLDAGEQMVPGAHFFVRSRHPWVVLPRGVPAFETGPGKGEALFDAVQAARVAAATGRSV